MRSTFLAPVLLLALGCEPEPPCEAGLLRAGLALAETSEDPSRLAAQKVLQTCDGDRFEPGLWSWLGAVSEGKDPDEAIIAPLWARVCEQAHADIVTGGRTARARAYEACGLGDVGVTDAETFVWSEGEPMLALSLVASVRADEALEVPDDVLLEVARVIGGTPLLPGIGDLDLLVVDSAPVSVKGPVVGWDELASESLVVLAASRTLGEMREALEGPESVVRLLALTPTDAYTEVTLAFTDDRTGIVVHPVAGGYEISVGETLLGPSKDCSTNGPAVCGGASDLAGRLAEIRTEHREAKLVVDAPDSMPFSEFVALPEALSGAHIYRSEGFAACEAPPNEGTMCIPGGPVLVGQHGSEAEPLREVVISTFYIDEQPVTNAEYAACIDAGACSEKHVGGVPDAPASGMPWLEAVKYCAWSGKRLPTMWEWEKAARGPHGEMFSWGSSKLGCEQNWSKACGGGPRAVSTSKKARYGLVDMEGNGAEWTSTWSYRSLERCGEDCLGVDPLGPCQASHPCTGYSARVVKGESWTGAPVSAASWRRQSHKTPQSGLGLRCATDKPYLTRFPPLLLSKPLPRPAPLTMPTEAQLALFHSVPDDPIEEKPICEEARRSTLECRDPQHYLTPNEDREHVFRRFIQNLGGCYVGVASDQNYSFAAIARSEWLFLMDYDPMVVRVHKMNIALVGAASTPAEFIALFEEGNADKAREIIETYWKDDPEVALTARFYINMRRRFLVHYGTDSLRTGTEDDEYGWLRVPEHYQHIRTLQQQNRVRAVKGDMLYDDGALRAIGRTCKGLGSTMRIYYTSNAPDVWGGQLTPEYKANVAAMPMDEHSVVVQAFGFPTGFGQTGYWHFNVQSGQQHQERMTHEGYNRIWELVTERIPTDDPDVTTMGLPSE